VTSSIFGFDLAKPAATGPGLCGPVNGAAAKAACAAMAEHFGIPFDQVRETLRPFLPQAMPHLRTPEGWALVASYIALDAPAAPAFQPVIH
jgi:hypothetical protein